MHFTNHADVRMNHRGVKRALVDLALSHGRHDGDRIVLTRRDAFARIEEIKREQKLLEHAARKGGLTIVCDQDVVITTYLGANLRERS